MKQLIEEIVLWIFSIVCGSLAIAGLLFAVWAGIDTIRNPLDPYSEGTHWQYQIRCENGFVYKVLDKSRGTIQILNSDGTPLRCGQKIY